MADNKTEEVKQKLENTDRKVKDSIKKIEESQFGKSIPMEIKGINLYNIIKFLNLFLLYSDLAIHLQIQAKASSFTGYKKIFYTVIKYLFYIVGFGGDVFALGAFIAGVAFLFKFILVFKTIKMVTVLLVMFFISEFGLFTLGLAMVFGILSCCFDFIHVYYCALFFERIESEDYDQYGSPVKNEVIEIKEDEQNKQQPQPQQA